MKPFQKRLQHESLLSPPGAPFAEFFSFYSKIEPRELIQQSEIISSPKMGEQVRDFILALLSGRGDDPMTITQLEAEYKDLEGTFIPAEELGYPNTEALLRSMKNVQLTRSGERIFVKVINCAHAQHVIELINGQKKDTVKQVMV